MYYLYNKLPRSVKTIVNRGEIYLIREESAKLTNSRSLGDMVFDHNGKYVGELVEFTARQQKNIKGVLG